MTCLTCSRHLLACPKMCYSRPCGRQAWIIRHIPGGLHEWYCETGHSGHLGSIQSEPSETRPTVPGDPKKKMIWSDKLCAWCKTPLGWVRNNAQKLHTPTKTSRCSTEYNAVKRREYDRQHPEQAKAKAKRRVRQPVRVG